MSAGEHCLRMGDAADRARPAILLIPPLFDESNRMRRTLVLTMRALAARGHASLLPDLPGQNDSIVPTADATISLWRDAIGAVAAAEPRPLLVASWRGGALIDDAATNAIGWWRMVPVPGASLLRTMIRTRIAGEREAGRTLSAEDIRAMATAGPVELAGNPLNAAMLAALEAATPVPVHPLREVSAGGGAGAEKAAGKIPGSALWLRAEPGEDAAMADAMAQDMADWASQCAAG